MEFKGTKGVWEINPKASRNVRCGNLTIANCSSGQNGDNEEEEFANAKLIAAAPEMFEFLRDMYEQEQCTSQSCHDELFTLLTKITKQ